MRVRQEENTPSRSWISRRRVPTKSPRPLSLSEDACGPVGRGPRGIDREGNRGTRGHRGGEDAGIDRRTSLLRDESYHSRMAWSSRNSSMST